MSEKMLLFMAATTLSPACNGQGKGPRARALERPPVLKIAPDSTVCTAGNGSTDRGI